MPRPPHPIDATALGDYFRNRPEVVAAYLFGSQAAGRPRPDSDVDIGVLLRHEALADKDRLTDQLIVDLSRLTRKDLHLVVLNRAGEMLLRQVLGKGRLVCVNDPKTLSRFKMVAVARIADFGDYMRIFERKFHQRLMEGRADG